MVRDQDLLEAARNGNVEIVCKALEQINKRNGPLSSFRRSPNINTQDVNGYTPLHHACLNGHEEVVRLLLSSENTRIDMADVRHATPLYLAAWAGRTKIVQLLLLHPSRPANPTLQTTENETPLHCAALHGHNDVLRLLLSFGANPSTRNYSFQTALDLAAEFGRLEAVNILINKYPEIIDAYRKSTDAETPTKHYYTHTCLHLASRNGHSEVVQALVNAGINVNILTHAGSALHAAALCGKKSVVAILLEAGIDIDAKDGNGKTALDLLQGYSSPISHEIKTLIKDFMHKTWTLNSGELKRNFDENSNITNFTHISRSLPKPLVTRKFNKKLLNGSKQPAGGSNINFITSFDDDENNNVDEHKAIKPPALKIVAKQLPAAKDPCRTPDRYLQMKPIMWSKSQNENHSQSMETLPTYDPVYKQPSIIYSATPQVPRRSPPKEKPKTPPKPKKNPQSYEFMSLPRMEHGVLQTITPSKAYVANTLPSCDKRANAPVRKCAEEYVQMSVSSASSSPQPAPRHKDPKAKTNGSAANEEVSTLKHSYSPKRSPSLSKSGDEKVSREQNRENTPSSHSPTPDFPPPTVFQAEHTILEFIQTPADKAKRQSIRIEDGQAWEAETASLKAAREMQQQQLQQQQLTQSVYDESESYESMGSRVSDCVEEFVGTTPFAGLFKGSTLNLAHDDAGDTYAPAQQHPPRLRSPSLVQSIKPLSNRLSLLHKHASSIDVAKEWSEIDSIIDSLGSEISKVRAEQEYFNSPSIKMRDPAELLLGENNIETATNQWCHSVEAFIYGQLLYNVYYLGSTTIKQLKGAESTRKSIQKLKRDANTASLADINENVLLEDCNNSTKYLKSNKSLLLVGLAVSHAGVKFIDFQDNQNTICVHNIENIFCVCQDAEDLRYFAYITKENELHYCHVFMGDTVKLATEIILTLGQAFEVAYQLETTAALATL